MQLIFLGIAGSAGMSDKDRERDTDNESLSDWTLVNQEETNEVSDQQEEEEEREENNEGAIGPPKEEKEEVSEEEEEEEDEEEEEGTARGSKVEELQGSGGESSDIETLDYPSVDESLGFCYTVNNGRIRLSIQNLRLHNYGLSYAVEADAESLCSDPPEEKLRKRRSRKPEATQDEETDLSLASSPSLPDDLPAIKPEPQYVHTPDQEFNNRLNLIVALTLACVIGLGLGHFLGIVDLGGGDLSGWSSRTLWEENLNAAQVRKLRELQDNLLSCISSSPVMTQDKQTSQHTELSNKMPDPASVPPVIPPFKCGSACDTDAVFAEPLIPIAPTESASFEDMSNPFSESLIEPLEDAGIILDSQIAFHEQMFEQFESMRSDDIKPVKQLIIDSEKEHFGLEDTSSFAGLSQKQIKKLQGTLHIAPPLLPMFKMPHVEPSFTSEIDSFSVEQDIRDDESQHDKTTTMEFCNSDFDRQSADRYISDIHYEEPNERIVKARNMQFITTSVDRNHFTRRSFDLDLSEVKSDSAINDAVDEALHYSQLFDGTVYYEGQNQFHDDQTVLDHDEMLLFDTSVDGDDDDDDDGFSLNIILQHDEYELHDRNGITSKGDLNRYTDPYYDNINSVDTVQEVDSIDDLLRNYHTVEYDVDSTIPWTKSESLLTADETSSTDENDVIVDSDESIWFEDDDQFDSLTSGHCVVDCVNNDYYSDNVYRRVHSINNADRVGPYVGRPGKQNDIQIEIGDLPYSDIAVDETDGFSSELYGEGISNIDVIDYIDESVPALKLTNKLQVDAESGFDLTTGNEEEPCDDELDLTCSVDEDTSSMAASTPLELISNIALILDLPKILEDLKLENKDLEATVRILQANPIEPIKIKGKEGKESRLLREQINQLITDGEDLRLAIARAQYNSLPDADRMVFSKAVQENHHLRTTVAKLTHMVANLNKLRASVEWLQEQNKELVASAAKIRYEQPMPRELKPLLKEMDSLKQAVISEARKKKPSPNLHCGKSYYIYLSQILSAFTSLHDDEVGAADKVDAIRDIFSLIVPKGVKLPVPAQEKAALGRERFKAIRESLQRHWKQLKELTKPENIAEVGQATLNKMNRVIVNVVNKLKDIGHMTIMKQNKKPVEMVVASLSDKINILNDQFDKTWISLQGEASLSEEEKIEVFGEDYTEHVNENEEDEDEEDNALLAGPRNAPPAMTATQKVVKEEPKVINMDLEFKKQMLMKEEERKKREMKKKEEERLKKIAKEEKKKKKDMKRAINEDDTKKKVANKVTEKVKTNPGESEGKEERTKEQKPHDDKKDRKRMQVKDGVKTVTPDAESRYFKGQYNKYDKQRVTEGEQELKHFQQEDGDRDNEDEDDRAEQSRTTHQETSSEGLRRHWEKPQKAKNFVNEENGAKKMFIRRKGKKSQGEKLGRDSVDFDRVRENGENEVSDDSVKESVDSYQYKNFIKAQKGFKRLEETTFRGKTGSETDNSEHAEGLKMAKPHLKVTQKSIERKLRLEEEEENIRAKKSSLNAKVLKLQEEKSKTKDLKQKKKIETNESKLKKRYLKLEEREDELKYKVSKFDEKGTKIHGKVYSDDGHEPLKRVKDKRRKLKKSTKENSGEWIIRTPVKELRMQKLNDKKSDETTEEPKIYVDTIRANGIKKHEAVSQKNKKENDSGTKRLRDAEFEGKLAKARERDFKESQSKIRNFEENEVQKPKALKSEAINVDKAGKEKLRNSENNAQPSKSGEKDFEDSQANIKNTVRNDNAQLDGKKEDYSHLEAKETMRGKMTLTPVNERRGEQTDDLVYRKNPHWKNNDERKGAKNIKNKDIFKKGKNSWKKEKQVEDNSWMIQQTAAGKQQRERVIENDGISWMERRSEERTKIRDKKKGHEEVSKKQHGAQRVKKMESEIHQTEDSWGIRRGEARERQRKLDRRSEWVFDRSRRREQTRQERNWNGRPNHYVKYNRYSYKNKYGHQSQ